MKHLRNPLESLRRPRLLINAARFGLSDYDREAVLARILGRPALKDDRFYLNELLELEATQNDKRLARDAQYSIARHVDLMVALIAEDQAMTTEIVS